MATAEQIQPEQLQMPALGAEGEPCPSCGSPLAADQRYCLHCGARRGDPRVPLSGLPLAAVPAGSNGAAVSVAPATAPPREASPLGAVLGIAALGIMLLIGVLI